ncbi:class I SAM-dependent methyltransferase [Roseibium aestuarii]|uniref:Class I SAM-dependent methyltransferase n=1 Tax=Roseibium aestuarii TaxID=2600299 RepID=A0ABW4K3K1_9HYPH|nr:rRNA adenine N-6-methyltransferase family protein [Roseibium aestuarii]
MKQLRQSGLKKWKSDRMAMVRDKAADELRFFRTWLESPLKTGAVSPSGPELAHAMAQYLHPHSGAPVLELGPGTGVVTEAILKRGVQPRDLHLIEYSSEFCRLLQARFPGVQIVEGDAYGLRVTLARNGIEPGTVQGIVSSLPLLTRPERERIALLDAALAHMAPGAPFIQFSYGLAPPIKPVDPSISVTISPWIWRNLPPARVFVYRRLLA